MQLIATYKGAEVFPNVNCTGAADLILKIGDQLVEIDVKLARWMRGGDGYYSWSTTGASTVELPVYPLLVIPEGDIMNWKIRWRNLNRASNSPPHCPPGLENFWKRETTDRC